MRTVFMIAVCGLAAAGCSGLTDSGNDAPYAGAYSNYTCPELAEEASRVSIAVNRAAGNAEYSGQRIAMDVGLVIFFPILVFQDGNYANPAEFRRLRQTLESIELASNEKKCGIVFQHVPPPLAPR